MNSLQSLSLPFTCFASGMMFCLMSFEKQAASMLLEDLKHDKVICDYVKALKISNV